MNPRKFLAGGLVGFFLSLGGIWLNESDAGLKATAPGVGAITTGTIDGATIGGTTPAAITGTTITANTKYVGTSGTVTVSTPVFAGTETWNAGGVTFTGMSLAITD